MSETRRPEADGYVLARQDEEYQRLNAQAVMWEEATRRTLAKAGIGPGQRCLDIGCGTGSVMRILGEAVGPGGRVLGIDLDARIGTLAVAGLDAEQRGRHSFAAVDVTRTDALAGAPFDVVFARLVLIHMPEPKAALRKFWSWVAPGGVLVLMDYDMTGLRSFPPNGPAERAIEIVKSVFTRGGRDLAIGSRLPTLLAESGVGAPDQTEVSGQLLPFGESVKAVRPLLRSLTPAAIALGVADTSSLEALDRELEREAGASAYVRGPDMIGVWKRKARA